MFVIKERYVIYGSKPIIFDTIHNKEWVIYSQLEPEKEEGLSFNEACVWVKTLDFDGGDWRMPVSAEISQLYASNRVDGFKIKEAFKFKWDSVWVFSYIDDYDCFGKPIYIGSYMHLPDFSMHVSPVLDGWYKEVFAIRDVK